MDEDKLIGLLGEKVRMKCFGGQVGGAKSGDAFMVSRRALRSNRVAIDSTRI